MRAAFDSSNEMFQLAVDLVNQTSRNIFLTGKAGTGKTTFLRYIREYSLKQTAVVAPTGVAAINAGGSTIHSFFQLPFSPYLPQANDMMHRDDATNKHTLLGKIKLNRERIQVLQQLELLIIDEISMVRCDVLDAIDVVLKHFRHRQAEPFGGVQLLVIGDMYQLPPVISDGEWNVLSGHYASPYFFDSRIMQQVPPLYIEFNKIYRQSDNRFIELLNQVRNNALTAAGKEILTQLYNPGFTTTSHTDHIILTTHNHKADTINEAALAELTSKTYSFRATVEGDFNEKAYPADELLRVKEGARVMFIKNDKEKIKRYYNGKIGIITKINTDGIFVQCKDEDSEIEVQKETWENIRYVINNTTRQLEEDVVGSFTQYPLRLAWAITIHKSQGLSFEKAVIDAGSAFAAGQVYVALSRCTSLDGIVLQSPITAASLRNDETIVRFSKQQTDMAQLQSSLRYSKKEYQQKILIDVFDHTSIIHSCNKFSSYVTEHQKTFNEAALTWTVELEKKMYALQQVADTFSVHLKRYFVQTSLPEEHEPLQKRVAEASAYFTKGLRDIIDFIFTSPAVTDSKLQAKSYNDLLKDLFILVSEKKHVMNGFADGFSMENYYSNKKNFEVPAFSKNAYATDTAESTASPHPELQHQLWQLRNKLCTQKNLPVYMVASSKSIDEMIQFLPQTPEALAQVSGFGKTKVAAYGNQFLDIINAYCLQHNLSSRIQEKQTKKERKSGTASSTRADTKTLSFELFQKEKNIAAVAAARNLAVSTIQSHLAWFVETGKISVTELLPEEKLQMIAPHLANYEKGTPLKNIILEMENKVSYGELRMAIAAKEWENLKNEV